MKPQVIVFDVNETLLNLDGMRESVAEALGGREGLLPLWFSTLLHHSLIESVTGHYHSFGEIGTAALLMVADSNGIKLSRTAALDAMKPLESLPPHTDVLPALDTLTKHGYRIVSLTNSSRKGVETQFKNAGLTDYFARRYSVEDIKKYKPHPATYQMVLDDLGVQPGEVLMVAAHAWDLMGAKNVGLQTAFVARPGKTLYPIVSDPDLVVSDLLQLVTCLETSE